MTTIRPETRDELDKLEQKHAEHPEGRYFVPLANAYRKAGELGRAMTVLREGIGQHPDYVSAHIVLGRCLMDEGDMSGAEAEFQQVLSLDRQNLIALRTLGKLAADAGRGKEAQAWYRDLLWADPMNEEAHGALESLQLDTEPTEDDSGSLPEPSAAAAPELPRRPSAEPESPSPDESPIVPEPTEPESPVPPGPAAPEVPDEPPVVPEPTAPEWPAPLDPTSPEPVPPEPVSPEPVAREAFAMDLPESFGFVELEARAVAEETVVTETIAQLYARQGFFSRAAEVYRELIRRRGANAELEERLSRVQDMIGEDMTASEDQAIAEMAEEQAVGAAPEAAQGVDPFADSFAEGFPGSEAMKPEAAAAAEAGVPAAQAPTIRGYLVEVLTWTAGGSAGAREEAAEPVPAVEEPGHGEATASWEPEAPGHAGPEAGEDLFPWEIPAEGEEAASALEPPAAWETPQLSAHDPQESNVEPVAEATREEPPRPSQPAAGTESERPEPGASTHNEEDDDLESFQAWLRSLKR